MIVYLVYSYNCAKMGAALARIAPEEGSNEEPRERLYTHRCTTQEDIDTYRKAWPDLELIWQGEESRIIGSRDVNHFESEIPKFRPF